MEVGYWGDCAMMDLVAVARWGSTGVHGWTGIGSPDNFYDLVRSPVLPAKPPLPPDEAQRQWLLSCST